MKPNTVSRRLLTSPWRSRWIYYTILNIPAKLLYCEKTSLNRHICRDWWLSFWIFFGYITLFNYSIIKVSNEPRSHNLNRLWCVVNYRSLTNLLDLLITLHCLRKMNHWTQTCVVALLNPNIILTPNLRSLAPVLDLCLLSYIYVQWVIKFSLESRCQ